MDAGARPSTRCRGGAPHRGCASSHGWSKRFDARWRVERYAGLWGHRDLLRNSPTKGPPFPGDSRDHPIGVFAPCAQWSIAFAEPHLGFPTYILDGFGHLCHPPLAVPTDLRWIPVSPGTFDEGAARVGVAGV